MDWRQSIFGFRLTASFAPTRAKQGSRGEPPVVETLLLNDGKYIGHGHDSQVWEVGADRVGDVGWRQVSVMFFCHVRVGVPELVGEDPHWPPLMASRLSWVWRSI